MIDFQSVNGWYKNSFAGDSFGGFFRGLSLPGRPAHTLTYPWPAKIPCQLRSPKDIINPKIIIFWGKKKKKKPPTAKRRLGAGPGRVSNLRNRPRAPRRHQGADHDLQGADHERQCAVHARTMSSQVPNMSAEALTGRTNAPTMRAP